MSLKSDYRSNDLADLLSAINNTATTVSGLYITFLLLLSYTSIIIASTTDEMLLKNTNVSLPLLNTDVPIVGFYIATPWLLTVFHIDLLLHFVILGRKVKRLRALLGNGKDKHFINNVLEQLGALHYLHLYSEGGAYVPITFTLRVIFFGILVLLPLSILLWAQGRFLPYHELYVTITQRIAVTIDTLSIFVCWPLISNIVVNVSIPSTTTRAWNLCFFLWCVILTSWCLFTVPIIDPLEVHWLSTCNSQRGIIKELCSWGFRKRNLDLKDRILVANSLAPEQVNTLKKVGTPERQRIIEDSILGLDLRGRDLRYADFSDSILPKADFRDAADGLQTNLEETNFERADLGNVLAENAKFLNANFSQSRLSHISFARAHLRNCIMQFADLSHADLHWADLTSVDMTAADLIETNLTGAHMSNAKLEATKGVNVRLDRAILQNSILRNATFTAATLSGAQLDGAELDSAEFIFADFSSATLKGATLSRALVTHSDFTGAHLEAVDFSYSTLYRTLMTGVSLTGADFRHAQIYAIDWTRARFKATDLRDIDLAPSPLKNIIMNRDIYNHIMLDNPRISTLLRAIPSRVGTKVFLSGATILKPIKCSYGNIFLKCRDQIDIDSFLSKRAEALKSLSCLDVTIANGIARQVLDTRSVTTFKEPSILSKYLIAGNMSKCQGIDELNAEVKTNLQKLAEILF